MAGELGRDASLTAIDRRTFLGRAAAGALAAGTAPLMLGRSTAYAGAPKPVKVGMTFPFSGVSVGKHSPFGPKAKARLRDFRAARSADCFSVAQIYLRS